MGAERRRDLLLLALSGLLILLGIWLRARQIGVPEGLAWDEHHFVKNAQNYLIGAPDWNDHPPLGKLLIAASIHWLGDDAIGWRCSALAAGVASIALAGVLASSLFRSWRAGVLGAAFVAGDGFFIAYSRTALLDGVVTTFVLAIACASVRARSPWRIALASVLLGLGCAVKFNAVVMVVPIVLAVFGAERAPRWSLVFLLLAPAAYCAVYALGLSLSHQPHGIVDVARATRVLWSHHLALTDAKHVYVSKWYTWLLPLKPIPMRFSQVDGVVRAMTSMGNPLLWWGASASVLAAASHLVVAGSAAVRARSLAALRTGDRSCRLDPNVLWAFGCWLLPVVPWILTRRDSYVYHYLPAYGFAVLLFSGHVARALERRPRSALLAVGAITALSVWMTPVWCEMPISRTGYELRLWFPGWRRAPPKPRKEPPSAALPRSADRTTLTATTHGR